MVTLGTGAARLDINFQIGSYRLLSFTFNTDISLWEFEFFLKKNKGDRLKVFSKTLSDGISFPIYSDDSIDVEIDSTDSQIEEGQYYYELRRTDTNTPLICGYAYLDFDAKQSDETSVSLTLTDASISVTVSNLSIPALRVYQVTSTATLTPDIDTYDSFEILSPTEPLLLDNPTVTEGNIEIFVTSVTDADTARATKYGDGYRAFGSALPTTTTPGKTLYLICLRNSTDDVYDTASREEV